MIIYWLLTFLIGVLGGVLSPLSLFPVATLPTGLSTALSSIGSITSVINLVLPGFTNNLFIVVSAYVAVEVAIFAYKGVKWIYNKIPGVQ